MAGDSPLRGVNRNNPDRWKADIALSVDMYNTWFMEFAPSAYRETRVKVTRDVEATLKTTDNLTNVSVALLNANPGILPTLRMSTCPPLAVDRLVGLAGVSKNLVSAMEMSKLPRRMVTESLEVDLERIGTIIEKMADPDIFVWLKRNAFQIRRNRVEPTDHSGMRHRGIKGCYPSLRAFGGQSFGLDHLITRVIPLPESEKGARFSGPLAQRASSAGL